MKKATRMIIGIIFLIGSATAIGAEPQGAPSAQSGATNVDDILDRVIARYEGPGFRVRFVQTSTLKAMNITDSAAGQIFIKRPGMMRWEYDTPSAQTIVSDGTDLWIYRPEDNQVMHGAAPAFFSGGKGAGFLSDMNRIRQDFDATLARPESPDVYAVKLTPKKTTYDVSAIHLMVSIHTDEVVALITRNAYGDETRFELIDYRFDQVLAPSLFQFAIPEGAEVLTLDQ